MLFPTDDLQKALSLAAPGSVLELSEGDFRCKIMIEVPDLTIRGQGAGKTRIIWDDYAKKPDSLAGSTTPSGPGRQQSVQAVSVCTICPSSTMPAVRRFWARR